MSKIKTPEGFAEQILYWLNDCDLSETNQKRTIVEMIKKRDLDYKKQKIEELKMKGIVAGYDDYGVGYKEGIDKAIEIIRGDGN